MSLDLAAIEARAAAATAGPWEEMDGYIMQPYAGGWCVLGTAHHGTQGTPAFIAHAREDIPALLAAVRTLEAEREELRRSATEQVRGLEAEVRRLRDNFQRDEARVTALEEAARQLIAKWEGIVRDCDAAGALLPHSGIVAEGFKVCAEELAAALLTKEGV